MTNMPDTNEGWRRWRLEQRKLRREKAEQDKMKRPSKLLLALRSLFGRAEERGQ